MISEASKKKKWPRHRGRFSATDFGGWLKLKNVEKRERPYGGKGEPTKLKKSKPGNRESRPQVRENSTWNAITKMPTSFANEGLSSKKERIKRTKRVGKGKRR